MSKGSASDLVIAKAQHDLRVCRDYLDQFLADPKTDEQQRVSRVARRRIRRLAQAVRDRDATKIGEYSAALSEVMIYLWAMAQLRKGGS